MGVFRAAVQRMPFTLPFGCYRGGHMTRKPSFLPESCFALVRPLCFVGHEGFARRASQIGMSFHGPQSAVYVPRSAFRGVRASTVQDLGTLCKYVKPASIIRILQVTNSLT